MLAKQQTDSSLASSIHQNFGHNLSLFSVKKRNGNHDIFSVEKIVATINRVIRGFEEIIDIEQILKAAIKNIFDGISTQDIETNLILVTTALIEKDPAYNTIAARILLQKLTKEVLGTSTCRQTRPEIYKKAFIKHITNGLGKIHNPVLEKFDLQLLADNLVFERDDLFGYMGLQTLTERYFLKLNNKRIELPQMFWMRVAMGLAIEEKEHNQKAIEFYNLISQMHYSPATPTLFHAATVHPQLSSCYLTTIPDDLPTIFKCLSDNAQLSKWSGGLGNDWTNIRGTGALIKTVGVTSQGVVPFLKIANDVTCAISRSGSRRGATTAYLETWHYDIEDFLDLRRNTGDERRRTHDMNTANWIPDLFMKRMLNNENWTLFSPDETPDLHDLYGAAFEKKYCEYEKAVEEGKITLFKKVSAVQLWRKMLTRLFETGHPWIVFKDPCNVRSPQDHAGVIHSSNLCTEITLNTSSTETAVCNLGSINLGQHVKNGSINWDMLQKTIKTAIRMLDNVITLNFYPTKEAKDANYKHRPIGLGVMGFQDALFELNIAMDSEAALEFSNDIMEFISFHAIKTSTELAAEKGAYGSFKGSKWDRGILPLDTIDLLEHERNMPIDVDRTAKLPWDEVREAIKKHGMRNSNLMAIAPTATISNITGCFPCTEPIYKNIYVKANMGGEFTIVNKYLINDLKKLNLWNDQMLDLIKYYDGDISHIEAIPQHLKNKYKESFDIDPVWLLKLSAVRAKWIDQAQSHNIFMANPSGKKMHEVYVAAWQMGVKTTYYFRTLGASQIEKSTLNAKQFGFTQKRVYTAPVNENQSQSCSLENNDCEACQ